MVAIGEGGGGSVVKQIGEGPLFVGTMAGVIDKERAIVEGGQNLLARGVDVESIGENAGGLQSGRDFGGCEHRFVGEVDVDVLVGDEQGLLIPRTRGRS